MTGIYDFTVAAADGSALPLADYEDRVVLVVNVASKCGYTPQYEGLEALYEELHGSGLDILGFPCNQFGGQEPGTADEIHEFCSTTYGVSFPVLAKIDVNGPEADPLFVYLRQQDPGDFSPDYSERAARLYAHRAAAAPETIGTDEIKWNFTKFLVGRDGRVIRRYETYVPPEEIRPDVEALLH